NSRQIEIIKNGRPKRQYYTFTPEGSRLFDLALNPLALAFVGVSDKEELAELKQIIHETGDTWYLPWLEHKGIDLAA
ncbi:TPA: hypothetical protein ACX6SN_003883, partial [Photobacterium damselae]